MSGGGGGAAGEKFEPWFFYFFKKNSFIFYVGGGGGGGGWQSKRSTPGLFTIFNKYHFTIEENTPLEQEVALDPELLGKVFENLLAAYNPETRETVRNQTGSYYTPRKIVDYMVDESLCTILTEKVSQSINKNTQVKTSKKQLNPLEDKIRALLDYSNDLIGYELSISERKHIVQAISEIKIIDPAVGSGAFPMAALHKLTLILNRIDANNAIWERLQRDMAKEKIKYVFEHEDKELRETQLQYINTVFEEYRNDFGRKLCLIQNNIYGVDIQPTAIQIAKLRFFISLAIEQEPTTNPNNNYGIHPLPNLETRFVAADALMPLNNTLDKHTQETLGQTDEVKKLEKLLLSNREQYFHANTVELKSKYRKYDDELRKQLISELNSVNKKAGYLDKVIKWNPYNQNDNANWFDPKYMFGIDDGFDIVIGNPPYIPLQDDKGKLANKYEKIRYKTFNRTGDIYQLFFEFGSLLLNKSGVLTYITSNSWLKTEYGEKTRFYLNHNNTLLKLIEMGKDVFESAIVDSCILILKSNFVSQKSFPAIDMETTLDCEFPPLSGSWKSVKLNDGLTWTILSPMEYSILDKIQTQGIFLADWNLKINRGITSGCNAAFVIDTNTRIDLMKNNEKCANIIKPMLRGKDIRRFYVDWNNLWIINSRKNIKINDYPNIREHLSQYYSILSKKSGSNPWYVLQGSTSDTLNSMFSKEKLFWADMSNIGRFSYSDTEMYCNNKGYIMVGDSLKYLCSVLNSSLIAWYIQNTAATTGMGLTEWTVVTVKRIPVPKISDKDQKPFISLVDEIISAKSKDLYANTQRFEHQLDNLVYKLYNLTNKEIAIVKNF